MRKDAFCGWTKMEDYGRRRAYQVIDLCQEDLRGISPNSKPGNISQFRCEWRWMFRVWLSRVRLAALPGCPFLASLPASQVRISDAPEDQIILIGFSAVG